MNEDLARIKAKFKARRKSKASLVAVDEDPRCPFCNCAHFRLAHVYTKDAMFRGRAWTVTSHHRICQHCGKSWVRVVSESAKDDPPQATPPPDAAPVKKKVVESIPIYRPTKDEIRAACEEIQRGWSPAERRRRATITDARWVVHLLKREDLGTLD